MLPGPRRSSLWMQSEGGGEPGLFRGLKHPKAAGSQQKQKQRPPSTRPGATEGSKARVPGTAAPAGGSGSHIGRGHGDVTCSQPGAQAARGSAGAAGVRASSPGDPRRFRLVAPQPSIWAAGGAPLAGAYSFLIN